MTLPAPATVRRGMLVALLLLWELVPQTGLLPELFLPALSSTLVHVRAFLGLLAAMKRHVLLGMG